MNRNRLDEAAMIPLIQAIRRITIRLKKENLHTVSIVLLILVLVGSTAFWSFERNLNFFDALWWSIVTVTTVGYGDISPATLGGRVTGIALMMLGIGFLGVLTATIAGIFVENKLRESRGMSNAMVKDHFVICGWNFRGSDIVGELRADKKSRAAPIVVIAQLEHSPLDDDVVRFIRGEVNEEALKRANVQAAQGVIMLSDDTLEAHVRDAKTILNTLTVKSLFADIYVCVELMESSNIEHCRRARADEVIVVGELSSNLLVRAALDHGITHMITELVSNKYGSELYKVDTPQSFIGKRFLDVLFELKQNLGIICVAVEKPNEGAFIANPDAEYVLADRDQLVVIAWDRPHLT
jgi:voltage-gated potassium channel